MASVPWVRVDGSLVMGPVCRIGRSWAGMLAWWAVSVLCRNGRFAAVELLDRWPGVALHAGLTWRGFVVLTVVVSLGGRTFCDRELVVLEAGGLSIYRA